MKIEQIYTQCLAQGAYYIEINNEVAIIDPLREIEPYIAQAKENHSKIKYIFETHFHADFVSGHITLAEKTGATIVYGPTAETHFNAHIAKDNEIFKLGNGSIKVLHTPGHTMESTTFLLLDEKGKEIALFSGDTLFLGDVGRPDLAQKSTGLTQEELAGMLFDSLQNKILPLPESVIVYPAHGAGSSCGKNMSDKTHDTLGNQKKTNYALRPNITKEEFIKEVTEGLSPPPGYFPMNVKLNKEGYKNIDEVLSKGLTPLTSNEFETLSKKAKILILDVRTEEKFGKAHIPNSIFIGLNGTFAPWVGDLFVDITTPIILVAPKGQEKEAITRLSRIGFDNTLGYLDGGIESWEKSSKKTVSVESVSAKEFETYSEKQEASVYDVRNNAEYKLNHIKKSKNIPLREINNRIHEYQKNEKFYIHCAGGYRSMIAASILKSKGIHHFCNILGGFDAIKKTTPLVSLSCSSNKTVF